MWHMGLGRDREAVKGKSLDRAVMSANVSRSAIRQWLAEQRRRAAAGNFSAEITKILWVATTPP